MFQVVEHPEWQKVLNILYLAQTFNLYKLKNNCIESEYHLFLLLCVGEFWQRGPVEVNGYFLMCVPQT